MKLKTEALCLSCVPLAIVLFGLAMGPLTHFTPPPPPTATAEEIASLYRGNSAGIIIGSALFLLSGTLLAPITALYSVLIRRMEGAPPLLAYTQLITGTVALVLFIPPALFWGAAAFRPDQPASQLLMLNDLGFLSFIWVTWPGILQVLTIGTAILQDRSPNPLFPRWVGYLNYGCALVFVCGSLAPLAKSGPFAWNGLVTHWIPVAVFLGWWLVMFGATLRAFRTRPAPCPVNTGYPAQDGVRP
jgi:hypothetical protein